jgi:2-polyprenyl-3-methyl-5-hydroxy-6-metoxy-1,4-benzoquinol methylase
LRRGAEILKLVRGLGLREPRILDLGCATGWFTAELAKLGSALGVDLSDEAIAIARENFPGPQFIAGDLYQLPLPTAAFDLVVCQEVVAHVPDQAGLVDRIASLLRPEGYLVITTVNKFVIERTHQEADPDAHIKKWLSRKDFLSLIGRRFDVLRDCTVIPMGNQGVLRLVNSDKLNNVLRLFVSEQTLSAWKESLGCGYTRIALARKRAH